MQQSRPSFTPSREKKVEVYQLWHEIRKLHPSRGKHIVHDNFIDQLVAEKVRQRFPEWSSCGESTVYRIRNDPCYMQSEPGRAGRKELFGEHCEKNVIERIAALQRDHHICPFAEQVAVMVRHFFIIYLLL
jgi:hypothetical protein